ncbi:hypothetical protein L9F63_007077, partial [Diploptera punctata]
ESEFHNSTEQFRPIAFTQLQSSACPVHLLGLPIIFFSLTRGGQSLSGKVERKNDTDISRNMCELSMSTISQLK